MLAQHFGIAASPSVIELRAGLADLLLLGGRLFETAPAGHRTGDAPAQPGGFEFAGRGAEDGLGGLQAFEEKGRAAGAEAGNHAQGEPVKFFLRWSKADWSGLGGIGSEVDI